MPGQRDELSDAEADLHRGFLRLAIAEAARGAAAGDGGPFGAVVVKDGQVLASGHNEVVGRKDPTAHAEMQAIRAACTALGAFQLTGCDVYASCEPCPMCLGALYWARPRGIYFAAGRADAAAAGFDDAFIYDELQRDPAYRRLPLVRLVLPEAEQPFALWRGLASKVPY
jgi:guanine deaminase